MNLQIHDFWHLDRVTKQDRQYLNREFSTNDGDTVDIYIVDLEFVEHLDPQDKT